MAGGTGLGEGRVVKHYIAVGSVTKQLSLRKSQMVAIAAAVLHT